MWEQLNKHMAVYSDISVYKNLFYNEIVFLDQYMSPCWPCVFGCPSLFIEFPSNHFRTSNLLLYSGYRADTQGRLWFTLLRCIHLVKILSILIISVPKATHTCSWQLSKKEPICLSNILVFDKRKKRFSKTRMPQPQPPIPN